MSKIGFRKALKTPITIAAIMAAVKLSTLTPGRIYAAAKTAIELIIKLINILILWTPAANRAIG
jgi:spore maturation protein SpmA